MAAAAKKATFSVGTTDLAGATRSPSQSAAAQSAAAERAAAAAVTSTTNVLLQQRLLQQQQQYVYQQQQEQQQQLVLEIPEPILRISREYTGSTAHFGDILIFERRLQKRHDDLLKTQRNFRVAVFVVLAVMVVMLWAIYVQISEGEGLVVLLVLAAAFVGLIVMLLVLVSAGIRGDHLYAAESFAPRVQRSLRHFSMSFTTMDAGKAHLSMAHKKLPRKFIDNFYRYRGSVEHGAPYVPQPNDNGRSNPSHTPPPMTRSNSNRSPPSLHVD